MRETSVKEHLRTKDPYFRELHDLERQKFDIVRKIIDYRIKNKLSQADLANQVKVSQRQISNIENGEFSVDVLGKVLLGIGMAVRIEANKLNPLVQKG